MAHEDPHHPIIDQPWRWKIVRFRFEQPQAEGDPFVDLTLERDGKRRTFRFARPQGIELKQGFPNAPGLVFFDVSARGLDDLKVRVDDFEAGPGGVAFWARDVAEVPD